MYLLYDQFICFRPDWREPIYFYLTAQEENAVPRLFVLPTNARRHCLIYDYYLLASFKLYSLNIDQPGSLLLHSKIFFHTAALGLKCEAGCKITSDLPDSEKACDRFLDRCMTTKVRISGPFRGFSSEMEIKNCSNSFVCEPTSDFNCK